MERARAAAERIVLPEGDDDRILKAAAIVAGRGIAELTILGDDGRDPQTRAAELGLDLGLGADLSTADPNLHARFAEEYARLRAHKGVTPEFADDTVIRRCRTSAR